MFDFSVETSYSSSSAAAAAAAANRTVGAGERLVSSTAIRNWQVVGERNPQPEKRWLQMGLRARRMCPGRAPVGAHVGAPLVRASKRGSLPGTCSKAVLLQKNCCPLPTGQGILDTLPFDLGRVGGCVV